MPLFDDSSPTPAQLAAKQVRQAFRSAVREAVGALRQVHQQIWLMDGLDPQDVFDQFTTEGAHEIDANDACIAFITAMAITNGQTIDDYIDAADYTPPAGVTLTVEMDDSVTVVGP